MSKIDLKVALIARAYFWFYRILGITFGGISINSENKFFVNKYLKYYGILCSILITLFYINGIIVSLTSEEILAVYKYGQDMIYWVGVLTNLFLTIQIIVNLWFLNLNSTNFMEILAQYNMKIGKNQIIIFIIWICHIIIPFVGIFYGLYSSKMIKTSSPMIAISVTIFKLCSFFSVWAFPFITWIISIHFFEFLKGIKQTLIEKLNSNNTGIYFF
jgi:hypothetical protein